MRAFVGLCPHKTRTEARTMASIIPYKDGRWRALVEVGGQRASKVFRTQREAKAWAAATERELLRRAHESRTVFDLLLRYGAEVTPTKGSARTKTLHIHALLRDFPALAAMGLSERYSHKLASLRCEHCSKLAQQLRLEVARDLLESTAGELLPLASINRLPGRINDPAHFSRVFQQRFALSPRQYRRPGGHVPRNFRLNPPLPDRRPLPGRAGSAPGSGAVRRWIPGCRPARCVPAAS